MPYDHHTDLDHVVAHRPREDHVCQQPGVVPRAQTHLKNAKFHE